VLEENVAITLIIQKAMCFGQLPPLVIVIAEFYPIGQRFASFLITLLEALISPGKEVRCDSLLLWARQDEKVEYSPIILPGRKADHLPAAVLPECGIATFINGRATEPPGEINDMAAGKRHAAYEIKNTRQINFTAKWMAGNAHAAILSPYEITV
jgi:hypothetical protein